MARYAVILAGGSGTRLWPLSRREHPKQVRALLDDATLLQKTYARVREAFDAEHVRVATTAEHVGAVREQLPELHAAHVLVEPIARNTTAAIGYAALRLAEGDPDATFVTINADAHVQDVPAYLDAIRAAFDCAEHRSPDVTLIGLRPGYAETGYGYIVCDDPVRIGVLDPVPAAGFVEKPDAVTAQAFVAGGRHLWNPALFTFRAQRLLELFAEHLPEHARALASLRGITDPTAVTRAFLAMPDISIDYALMEKLHHILVIPAAFGWADVGHWRAVHEILVAESGTTDVARGTHVALAGGGNLVVAPEGKLVATCGIEDCVIIDTRDALLICPRARAQDVREVVRELERRGLTQYL